MKKTILVVIDALASTVVEAGIESGQLPTLERLASVGSRSDCTAVFPSITPAATASLATGCYPSRHQIAGNYWYDRDADEIAYFGDDIWVVMKKGFGAFFQDFLVRLNEERLQVPTVFDRLAELRLSSACLNLMWYHGATAHDVNAPLLLELLTGGSPVDHISGPEVLYLGDFVSSRVRAGGGAEGFDSKSAALTLCGTGGVAGRYGFQDQATAEVLMQLVEADALPDFTLAYFPDNDFESHHRGPCEAIDTLQKVDAVLGGLVERVGSWERFLDEYAIVITGDHSQSGLLADADERRVDLAEALADFQQAELGKSWQSGDQLMACPNLRAAQIYLHERASIEVASVVNALSECSGIDQVIWRERNESGGTAYCVHSSDHGRLIFEQEPPGRARAQDVHGNGWDWRGELGAVDARVIGERVEFADYPNAWERIANSFCEVSGDLWVTAKVGREFSVGTSKLNERGSHGSLHRLDSTSPLITAGLPAGVAVPENARSVDVVALCLAALGVGERAPVS